MDGKIVWVFGDTFSSSQGWARNSAAIADPGDPTNLTDAFTHGRISPVVPFTDTESADNIGDRQWVIWPASIIPTSGDSALIFSTKFHATYDGWTAASLLVSRYTAGQTETERLAEPLTAPESNFATGPFVHGGYVYLMDCGGLNVPPQAAKRLMPGLPATGEILGWNGTGACRIGRVPLGSATDRAAYRFWTGTAWLPTSLAATAIIPGSNAGLSVAWSPKLKRFVALSVPGISNEIQVSMAPAITGPWTDPETIFKGETTLYAVRIHPELSPADLSTMAVSYFRQDQPGKQGAVVLNNITLDGR